MSFNRKYLTIESLMHYMSDEKSMESFLRTADVIISKDSRVSEIYDLWVKGDKEEAKKKLEEHVSRIAAEASRNS